MVASEEEGRAVKRMVLLGVIVLSCEPLLWADDAPGANVPAVAAQAREKGKAWRKDAILVEIDMKLRPPTVDQRPPGFDYEFFFYSPSEGSAVAVNPDSPGQQIFSMGYVDWANRKEIPNQFLDFPKAVERAQAAGMSGRVNHATLQVETPDARMSGLTWLFWTINGITTYPVPAELDQPWQNSWDAFIKEVQQMSETGATLQDFSKHFDNKQVHWEGKVVSASAGGPSGITVKMRFPSYQLHTHAGVPAETTDQEFQARPFTYSPDKPVKFQATLVKPQGVPASVCFHTYNKQVEGGTARKVTELMVSLTDWHLEGEAKPGEIDTIEKMLQGKGVNIPLSK